MPHADHHHPVPSTRKLTTVFVWGIALNLLYSAVEFGIGVYSGSMGLIADAGHNLSDVVSLVMALLAIRLSARKATRRYTYGFKKSTILASLFNAVLLLIAVGMIAAESISKFFHPQPVEGAAIAWTAGAGVIVNFATAWLLMRGQERDLNVRGAFLHMVADALVSIGVVVSGIVIARTGWMVIDPIMGIVIALIIVVSTRRLLWDSLRLSLDGVPDDIDVGRIEELVRTTPGVIGIHHLHIWAISTTQNALTVHAVLADEKQSSEVRREIRRRLRAEGITHATIETELPSSGGDCDDPDD